MAFAKNVWKLLVAVKDGLALLFLLLFFIMLFAILTARPSAESVKDGALLLNLDGFIVEERAPVDPFAALFSQEAPTAEYDVQDVVFALESAAEDDRIKAVVLDLREFIGAGAVHLREVGDALEVVKAADKPVYAYAFGYANDGLRLAAHADEVWVDPFGGATIAGNGGNNVYFAQLLDNIGINARVYRVGTYKSAVEPVTENGMSDAARENALALNTALWEQWQEAVRTARPKANIALATEAPAEWIQSANGDVAIAAREAGLVDRLGSWAEFGAMVAELVGEDDDSERAGAFAHTSLATWIANNDRDTPGKAIGVITIAGAIDDSASGPGTAGAERIAKILDEALDEDLAGLVVRVDSPGGSVTGSETIRQAILRHKAKDIPVAVSMANVAASGGYWVSTPANRIFAEPETITGSIGVFGLIPTFEPLARDAGVSTDGAGTTVLSGQPDFIGGFNTETDQILQAGVEDTYRDFITLVGEARSLETARVDEIGQGRVWDGGTARQINLIDQFGDLDDALAWVAEQAELDEGDWHASFLGSDDGEYNTLLRRLVGGGGESGKRTGGDFFAFAAERQARLPGLILADADRLLTARGIQAYCLGCPATPRPIPAETAQKAGWFETALQWIATR